MQNVSDCLYLLCGWFLAVFVYLNLPSFTELLELGPGPHVNIGIIENWWRFSAGYMFFLSPNQKCHSSEGNSKHWFPL